MKISGFMIPQDKVATVEPSDTIKRALDAMLKSNVGSIVVLMHETDDPNELHVPVGILTKTDVARAYQKELSLETSVREIMTHDVETVRDNLSRDEAARVFREKRIHHAVVVNERGRFVGLVSSWDIASECVRDAAAWPWIRSEDGKFHKPNYEEITQSIERGGPRTLRDSHAFLDFVDSVRELPFMDD
jgi:CBS domain-containing protein